MFTANPISASPSAELAWVICLCAEWCGACREYRLVFDQVAKAHPQLRFVWIDIEDQADLVGDIDIETFPTLVIADEQAVRFAGPLLPQAATLSRLVAALSSAGAPRQSVPPVWAALMARLQAASSNL